ncbi:efflux RND transporter periplasmic adaptor subunit [Steroidobacter agaridevorans]|uniref:efflux RND transporter periplasmic adaptor subunit n=1 Tax=Steroidobacter agaridevorans TaxID=2695856 RepID=UPI001326FF4D|nr:efflux RND transporter periplasmic adaptor subunit [Steroidobacter agaridevorans]GFE86041.1 membrane protein [Steroidobacter agaridevorans]
MSKRSIALAVVALLALAALGYWVFGGNDDDSHIVLQGNVDLRQIELPFNDSERIAEVLVEEGSTVKAGQVLARLDTGRLLPRVAQAEARAAAQREVLRKLRNGARPEEVAQARAALAAAQAEAANATSQLQRLRSISDESKGRAISPQDLEAAIAAARMSEAQAESSRKALELTLAGPRQEEIDQAKAQLDAAEADLALLKRQLADADLLAPTDGVIRNRLMEPGELATPQRPVFAIAITTPKWVRAYLSEVELSRVALGAPARVTMDSAPNNPLEGKVGFISSTAEFTPKTVQTEELRTSLVYEIRVFVDDPEDRLRLGMPATVTITPTQQQANVRESGR